MAYFLVEDFAGGLDLRKSVVTAKPGGLRTLKNAFVNAGGEVEQRRRFAEQYTLPPGTFGLAGLGGRLYVFGTADPGSTPVPLPFVYRQIVPNPALAADVSIDRVLDADVFGSKVYCVVRFTDSTVRHFYDGVQVSGVFGRSVKTHKSKLYAVDGNLLRFSAINAPADWAGTGSGLIDVTSQDFGSADLVGLETYYNSLALFGQRSIQIWTMDPDPAANQQNQVLANIGLIAPNATARYGSGDVLFLADTGIRSLRARDSSNAAVLNDIGSPIDEYVRTLRRAMTSGTMEKIQGLVDPLSGHVWFVWQGQILVLSYYPASKVTAWSVFEPPAPADYATIAGNRVFLRAGSKVYVYGSPALLGSEVSNINAMLGDFADEYGQAAVEATTPMLDFGRPATFKTFTGLDIACEGVWTVDVNTDPLAPDAWVRAATVHNTTYSAARIPIPGYSTHIALRLRAGDGFSRLGAVGVHFETADAA